MGIINISPSDLMMMGIDMQNIIINNHSLSTLTHRSTSDLSSTKIAKHSLSFIPKPHSKLTKMSNLSH